MVVPSAKRGHCQYSIRLDPYLLFGSRVLSEEEEKFGGGGGGAAHERYEIRREK